METDGGSSPESRKAGKEWSDEDCEKATRKTLLEKALIEIQRHRSIQDTCKFYKRLNNVFVRLDISLTS
jgi:hypothetical protein